MRRFLQDRSGRSRLPVQIHLPVTAFLTLAFDLAVANQAIDLARVLRSSAVSINRDTAVQDSHAFAGIISMILASVLRALMRCGSLLARSVRLRNIGARKVMVSQPSRLRPDASQDTPSEGDSRLPLFGLWPVCRGRKGDLFPQFGADVANFRRH